MLTNQHTQSLFADMAHDIHLKRKEKTIFLINTSRREFLIVDKSVQTFLWFVACVLSVLVGLLFLLVPFVGYVL